MLPFSILLTSVGASTNEEKSNTTLNACWSTYLIFLGSLRNSSLCISLRVVNRSSGNFQLFSLSVLPSSVTDIQSTMATRAMSEDKVNPQWILTSLVKINIVVLFIIMVTNSMRSRHRSRGCKTKTPRTKPPGTKKPRTKPLWDKTPQQGNLHYRNMYIARIVDILTACSNIFFHPLLLLSAGLIGSSMCES